MSDYADTVLSATPDELRVMIVERKGWVIWQRGTHKGAGLIAVPGDDDMVPAYWVEVKPSDVDFDQVIVTYSNWPGDINAAWGLAEEWRLVAKKRFFNVWAPSLERKEWYSGFCVEAGVESYHGYGNTAPEAICRAWLLAMEEKK